MDVRCERCRAQYVFDDDQVTAAGLTVQCTNCGHLFKVKKKELVVTVPVLPEDLQGTPLPATSAALRPNGTQAAMPAAPPRTHASIPAMPAAPAPEPERQREWRVRQATGNVFTFRELTTLQKWIIEQRVGRDDEISQAGEAWSRLGDISELAGFFQVVEDAERSRSQPALPAVTGFAPPPPPAYGAAGPTPPYTLAPPSGFPPPSFTTLPAQPAPQPQAPAHDVDVTFDDERPPKPRSSSRVWIAALGAAVLAGGGAVVIVPRLVSRPPPPPAPVVVAPTPPPAPPPEAAPPPPAPAPAPEPAGPPAPTELVKPAPPAPRGAKALLARARVLQGKGETEEALELYGRVASDEPENVEAQAGRGLCYLDLENWAPAEASFQAALRLEPDHADALLGLAETYRFQGKKAEAIPAYERYLARYPDGEEAQVAKHALAELRK